MAFRGFLVLLAAITIAPACSSASADEFRVENKVFVGSDKEPRVTSTTIFHDDVVYDYLEKPAEITVLDRPHRRMILLDVGRRQKTELGTDEIAVLNDQLKQWAVSHTDPLLKFLADPKLEETTEEDGSVRVYQSSWMTYRVKTSEAPSQTVAHQYRDFSDWHALLNTRINPGSRPPFARLIVNESLERSNLIPKEIELTLRFRKNLPFQKSIVRSEHHFVSQLVQSDRDRIAQTGEFLAMFPKVDFSAYQKTAEK